MNQEIKNPERFLGVATTYESVRPALPPHPIQYIKRYLGKDPDLVVDLGCGTGLSTAPWEGNCNRIIGVDANEEMLAVARKKQSGSVSFVQAYSHETGLPDGCADAIVCSQSFHWMEPVATLAEINRMLKPCGVFATVDCDWPPVCDWAAEKAYADLLGRVYEIERQYPEIGSRYPQWDKNGHLANMKPCGYFRYAREIVFANEETCSADRLIGLAISQGGLRGIMKTKPELIAPQAKEFVQTVRRIFKQTFNVSFCYRMRIAVK